MLLTSDPGTNATLQSGTWLENTYPGVRCDIPSHAYQSTFEPNPSWPDVFSYGPQIRDYWQGVARKHDVYKYVKLSHRVEAADWDDVAAVWRIAARDIDADVVSVQPYDVVITAVGRFNNWKLPDYPGISDYKGLLRHAQNWDPSFDATDKNVAIIGNGASGIQLVANLQKTVGHLDHYVRNRTWISPSWASDERLFTPQPYSTEQIAEFEKSPERYLTFRKGLEAKYWSRFQSFIKGSEANESLRKQLIEVMTQRVAKKPALLQDLIPDFSPNCRRLTPGPGYLEALSEDNVDYIRTPIKRFTETGIETEDGIVRIVDAIICATGANQSLVPPFPIRARGESLEDVWGTSQAEDGLPKGHGHPYTYLGTATPGFPNLFYVGGPNNSGTSGTVPYSVETQVTFLARILRKVSREGIRSIEPSADATDEFEEYLNAFFATSVVSESCSSWYNGGNPGGFISGIYPGSSAALAIIRREPRWEDWKYSYVTDQPGGRRNRFLWYFGKGSTKKEEDAASDMVPYLHLPGTVDIKDLHEPWWQYP